MTDHNDYSAKIRAKGLDSTGITEQIAADMYRNKGRRYMGIVELVVDETHEKADGTRKVDLILSLVEPAADDHMAEHLRELTRVTYRNRQQADGQLAIDDQLRNEPTVAQVLEGGRRFRPHPFIADDMGKDTPICDVCGGIEASAVHSAQDQLPDGDNEDLAYLEEGDDVYEATTDVEEVTLDHAPSASELANIAHIHYGGRCVTNRLGKPCSYDGDGGDPLDSSDYPFPADNQDDQPDETWEYDAPEGQDTSHLAAVPNPFTTPDGAA